MRVKPSPMDGLVVYGSGGDRYGALGDLATENETSTVQSPALDVVSVCWLHEVTLGVETKGQRVLCLGEVHSCL